MFIIRIIQQVDNYNSCHWYKNKYSFLLFLFRSLLYLTTYDRYQAAFCSSHLRSCGIEATANGSITVLTGEMSVFVHCTEKDNILSQMSESIVTEAVSC